MSDERTIAPENLPSNIGHGALPASLVQCQAVDRALAPLAALTRRGFYHGSAEAIAARRQALDRVAAQVRDVWPAVNRRARAEEIVFCVGLLMACFPDRRTAEEKQIFQHLMCNDVANSAPSLYALQKGCERLRRKFRFQQLQIADVIEALDQGKARGKRMRLLIEAIPRMRAHLDTIKPTPPLTAAQLAAQAAQRAAEAAQMAAYAAREEAGERRKLRQRIEWHWPPLNPFDYKPDDLRRLCLTGLCQPGTPYLSSAGWEELQEMKQSDVLVRLGEADRLAAEAEAERNAEHDDE